MNHFLQFSDTNSFMPENGMDLPGMVSVAQNEIPAERLTTNAYSAITPETMQDGPSRPDDNILNNENNQPSVSFHEAHASGALGPGGTTEKNDTVEKFGSTMGQLSIDEYGKLRYSGSTSNLQTGLYIPPITLPEMTQPTREMEDRADSQTVQSHLLSLYWKYHHPAQKVLHKDTFLADYAKGTTTQYFSHFLLNCMLLRSVRFTSDPTIRPLEAVYLMRVKRELITEFDHPVMTTMQALCLFGEYVGNQGKDTAGWLYTGQLTSSSRFQC